MERLARYPRRKCVTDPAFNGTLRVWDARSVRLIRQPAVRGTIVRYAVGSPPLGHSDVPDRMNCVRVMRPTPTRAGIGPGVDIPEPPDRKG